MGDLQFRELKWENHNTFLFSQLQFMLEEESYVDVILASTEGQNIKVHRFVLCAASSYFKDLLSQHPSAKTTTIVLQDVSHEILKALVEFIYKGEITVRDEDQVALFLKAAASLQIMGLMDKPLQSEGSQMDQENEFNHHQQGEIPMEDTADSSRTDQGENQLEQAQEETNLYESEDGDEMRQEIVCDELLCPSEHSSLEDVNSSAHNSSADEAMISSTIAGLSGSNRKAKTTTPSPKTSSSGNANKKRGKYQKSSEARRTAADPNRPYECSKCGRNYKRKNHLTRHSAHECVGVVIPSQPYECSECGRRYKRKDHLLRHSAHECVGIGRSFSCTECNYRAKRKHHLTRHLLRVHKIDHPPSVFRT